jgi:DNA-binding beta-propeller fold protein YncE
MKQNARKKLIISLLTMATMSGSPVFAGEGSVSASYLYTLSNFTGVYAVTWGAVTVDEAVNEVYVVIGGRGIKVFNDTGMEIYSFNDEQELGNVSSVAVDDEGNIIALVLSRENRPELIRCNYRGEFISKIELKNIPAEFADFSPNAIIFRNGSFYLVNEVQMAVVVTDRAGLFKEGYDLARLIGYTEQDRADTGLGGFNVDREGNLLFTIQATAKAYVVSPDRTVRSFGRSGSTPGTFGVPGGIVADISGRYILVADLLRCRIVVFDRDLKFCTEFGYRGVSPDALIGPLGLAVDGRNRLYVSQLRDRGVSVYQIATGG